jgi:hypothetical protein
VSAKPYIPTIEWCRGKYKGEVCERCENYEEREQKIAVNDHHYIAELSPYSQGSFRCGTKEMNLDLQCHDQPVYVDTAEVKVDSGGFRIAI